MRVRVFYYMPQKSRIGLGHVGGLFAGAESLHSHSRVFQGAVGCVLGQQAGDVIVRKDFVVRHDGIGGGRGAPLRGISRHVKMRTCRRG